jgi:hypothetical protein
MGTTWRPAPYRIVNPEAEKGILCAIQFGLKDKPNCGLFVFEHVQTYVRLPLGTLSAVLGVYQKIGNAVCVAPTAQQVESRTGAKE